MWTRYRLFEAAPSWIRRLLWKITYNAVAYYRPRDFSFMNLGYMPKQAMENAPEPRAKEWLPAEMYRLVGCSIPIEGRRVLEVGSGRGGGASLLCTELKPASYVGLDRSSAAVQACKVRYGSVPNLKFMVGDAENLPFADASWDAVLNVESSHCYGDFALFVREVSRVLVDGGYFAWADCHFREKKQRILDDFKKCGFRLKEEHDMTDGVLSALRVDRQRFRKRIGTCLWIESGRIWKQLESRTMVFTRCVLRKDLWV